MVDQLFIFQHWVSLILVQGIQTAIDRVNQIIVQTGILGEFPLIMLKFMVRLHVKVLANLVEKSLTLILTNNVFFFLNHRLFWTPL